MSEREHDAREVEALARELRSTIYGASATPFPWDDMNDAQKGDARRAARMILDRETRLVAALERIADSAHDFGSGPCLPCVAADAIAAHRASRQPSEPSLAEALEQMFDAPRVSPSETVYMFKVEDVAAVKAALAREREKGGGK